MVTETLIWDVEDWGMITSALSLRWATLLVGYIQNEGDVRRVNSRKKGPKLRG
jgi:hypothetical protein